MAAEKHHPHTNASHAASSGEAQAKGAGAAHPGFQLPLGLRAGNLGGASSSPRHRKQAAFDTAIENLVTAGNKGLFLKQNNLAFKALSKAVELAPGNVAARMAFATVLDRMGKSSAAAEQIHAAIALEPGNPKPYVTLGKLYWRVHRIADARELFAKALDCDAEFMLALDRLLHADAHLADWSRFARLSEDTELLRNSAEAVDPFALLPVADDPFFQRAAAERYARQYHRLYPEEPIEAQSDSSKIRIGYFSCDFFNHATMVLIGQLFELHDRERFTVVLYDYGHGHDDAQFQRAKQTADEYRNVAAMSDREIAMLARDDRIDVAVDLKGYTQGGRSGIFAVRAAPVQVSFLGFPGTVGMPAMDYILADPVVIPEELRSAYSEKTLNMPHCYQINDSSRVRPAAAPLRAAAGLPDDAFVFCSFNNSYKISPREFDIWMRLLKQVPGSVLWCFAGQKEAEANLRLEAEKRGVSAARIIFARRVPGPAHMDRHQLADLFLDTFAVNAHTTASDALFAGVPVVTKLGRQFAARVAGSILTAAGLPELVTRSEEEYEALALRLARNPEELSGFRQRLVSGLADSPLFDNEKYARHLETGLEAAVRRHRQGLPADHIQIAG